MANILQFGYVSRAIFEIGSATDNDILEEAVRRNYENRITGCLLRTNSYFLQVIEGAPDNVVAMMDTIRQDQRHWDIRELSPRTREARSFPKWSMILHQDDRPEIDGVLQAFFHLSPNIGKVVAWLRQLESYKSKSLDEIPMTLDTSTMSNIVMTDPKSHTEM
jgi:hypothetical protein